MLRVDDVVGAIIKIDYIHGFQMVSLIQHVLTPGNLADIFALFICKIQSYYVEICIMYKHTAM